MTEKDYRKGTAAALEYERQGALMVAERIGMELGADSPAFAIAMRVAEDLEGLRDEAVERARKET